MWSGKLLLRIGQCHFTLVHMMLSSETCSRVLIITTEIACT
jgi:hypothetical protein